MVINACSSLVRLKEGFVPFGLDLLEGHSIELRLSLQTVALGKGVGGFKVMPKRWIVERTFG